MQGKQRLRDRLAEPCPHLGGDRVPRGGAGAEEELGLPEGLQTLPGLGTGCRGRPCPCPPPPQDTDDKWVCVLGRQRRLRWGHRSPSPGSHTAVPSGATIHPTSQPGPWTWGGSSQAARAEGLLLCAFFRSVAWLKGLSWELSQQLLTPQRPRERLAPAPGPMHRQKIRSDPSILHTPSAFTRTRVPTRDLVRAARVACTPTSPAQTFSPTSPSWPGDGAGGPWWTRSRAPPSLGEKGAQGPSHDQLSPADLGAPAMVWCGGGDQAPSWRKWRPQLPPLYLPQPRPPPPPGRPPTGMGLRRPVAPGAVCGAWTP